MQLSCLEPRSTLSSSLLPGPHFFASAVETLLLGEVLCHCHGLPESVGRGRCLHSIPLGGNLRAFVERLLCALTPPKRPLDGCSGGAASEWEGVRAGLSNTQCGFCQHSLMLKMQKWASTALVHKAWETEARGAG